MAVPAATNCWTKAEARIAEAISNSAAFQTLTNSANATEAAAWLFGEQLDEPLLGDTYSHEERSERFPHYCQVYSDPSAPYSRRRTDTRHYWAAGQVICYFEREVTALALDGLELPQAVERDWKNTVGDILDDVIAWLEVEGGPVIQGFDVTDGPGTNPKEEWQQNGIWQGCEVSLEWGIGGQ